MYLLCKLSAICIKILAISVVSVIRPASEFILIIESYNWDLPVEPVIIFHAVFSSLEEGLIWLLNCIVFASIITFFQDGAVFFVIIFYLVIICTPI